MGKNRTLRTTYKGRIIGASKEKEEHSERNQESLKKKPGWKIFE